MKQLDKRCIYPFSKRLSLIHLRFIDGTFFTWTGSKNDIMKFLNKLYTKYPTITYSSCNKSDVSFFSSFDCSILEFLLTDVTNVL